MNKPKVLISRCLTFENCRYDGGIVNDDFVEKLKDYIDFVTICPEVEIGLGIPRKWLSLVKDNDNFILYQRATDKDFTQDVKRYAQEVFSKISDVDGFILKGRSPSCGIKDVGYSISKKNRMKNGKSSGIFGHLVKEKYKNYPVETEGRLRNFEIRENFLTELYTLLRYKEIQRSMKMSDLVEFQASHKLLFQSFNEEGMRKLGKICANLEKRVVKKVIEDYHKNLLQIFSKERTYKKNINVLDHCFGFISEFLTKDEKNYYFEIMSFYRKGKLPLSVPLNIIRGWAIRHSADYLLNQYYFKPYPLELMDITDSGKGRDY